MRDSEGPLTAVQIRIYGRVQGVWFRAWTVKQASERGLAGWVRNRADDSVEALFVGLAADVEDMIAQCRDGPPAARVDDLIRGAPATEPEAELRTGGFRQLPTK